MGIPHHGELLPEGSNWKLIRFDEDRDDFIKRPPYQRKNVWDDPDKRSLIDSFLRKLYVPPIVLRTVTHETKQYYEVIDGQQRITSIQEYFNNEFALSDDNEELLAFDEKKGTNFSGSYFEELTEEEQNYLAQDCKITVDTLRGISDPTNSDHQELATQVFWRLQQGESLNNLEENHSKIYSPVRNYIVERADDIKFDMETYTSLDENPDRHEFFTLLNYGNNRLKHLGLLARFILIEIDEGPAKITNHEVTKLFDCEAGGFRRDETQSSFKQRDAIERVDKMLDLMYEIYSEEHMTDDDGTVVYFENEYFIISLYTLVRELTFGDYRFNTGNYEEIREFSRDWYNRFENEPTDDDTILRFKQFSQQNADSVSARHWYIMNAFWNSNPNIEELDGQRTFTHRQRVEIFLRDDRICPDCLEEEKAQLDEDEDESVARNNARVNWSDWEADHIVKHAEGGATTVENGRVRCPDHNQADNQLA
ncbi:DUF262 domain-containing protein [Halobacterium salinarum]|uniref:DUF262 domain-containing protein n=1 Tax=Halobacterium salinarum TaxID=2242 RepID=UPI002553CE22|nr:DUF262 domain-containing protein [Halobacterium salinarum]MDL0140300.1 DUF262 domain-containing protein [Halobacterium salinarum]